MESGNDTIRAPPLSRFESIKPINFSGFEARAILNTFSNRDSCHYKLDVPVADIGQDEDILFSNDGEHIYCSRPGRTLFEVHSEDVRDFEEAGIDVHERGRVCRDVNILRQLSNFPFPIDPERTFLSGNESHFCDKLPPIVVDNGFVMYKSKKVQSLRIKKPISLMKVVSALTGQLSLVSFSDMHFYQPRFVNHLAYKNNNIGRGEDVFQSIDEMGEITHFGELEEEGEMYSEFRDMRNPEVIFGYKGYYQFFSQLACRLANSRGEKLCYIYRDRKGEYNILIGGTMKYWHVKFSITEEIYDHRGTGIPQFLELSTSTDCMKSIYSFLSPCCSKTKKSLICNNSNRIKHEVTETGFHFDIERANNPGHRFQGSGLGFPLMSPEDLYYKISEDYEIPRLVVKTIFKNPKLGKKAIREIFGQDCKRYTIENIKKIKRNLLYPTNKLSGNWQKKMEEYRELRDCGSYEKILEVLETPKTDSVEEIIDELLVYNSNMDHQDPLSFVKKANFGKVHWEMKKNIFKKKMDENSNEGFKIIKTAGTDGMKKRDLVSKLVISSYDHYHKAPRKFDEEIGDTKVPFRRVMRRRDCKRLQRKRYIRKLNIIYRMERNESRANCSEENDYRYKRGMIKLQSLSKGDKWFIKEKMTPYIEGNINYNCMFKYRKKEDIGVFLRKKRKDWSEEMLALAKAVGLKGNHLEILKNDEDLIRDVKRLCVIHQIEDHKNTYEKKKNITEKKPDLIEQPQNLRFLFGNDESDY